MTISTDTFIGITFGAVIAFIFFILGLYIRSRPKLIYTGGGCFTVRVDDQDVMVSHLRITNKPTFWGMKVLRAPAKIDNVRLYDPILKIFVGTCLLWSAEDSRELTRKITIESGDKASLNVVAKDRFSDEYFIPQGKNLDIKLDKPANTFNDHNKEYSIHITEVTGVITKFDIIVSNQKGSQSVGLRCKKTIYDRLQHIKKALRKLRYAFSIN